jgi:large subunit ribosomal protein L23
MKDARTIILKVLLTEKGTRLQTDGNQYQFQVARDANKLEIKRAVEALFNVHVTKVNTMNCLGKMKRTRTMHSGKTPDWKRAIVKLKTGDTITYT